MAEDAHELESRQLTKDAINSVLGLWSTPQRYVYSVETTTCSEDLIHRGNCRKRAVPGHDTLYDYISRRQGRLSPACGQYSRSCLTWSWCTSA